MIKFRTCRWCHSDVYLQKAIEIGTIFSFTNRVCFLNGAKHRRFGSMNGRTRIKLHSSEVLLNQLNDKSLENLIRPSPQKPHKQTRINHTDFLNLRKNSVTTPARVPTKIALPPLTNSICTMEQKPLGKKPIFSTARKKRIISLARGRRRKPIYTYKLSSRAQRQQLGADARRIEPGSNRCAIRSRAKYSGLNCPAADFPITRRRRPLRAASRLHCTNETSLAARSFPRARRGLICATRFTAQ